MTSPSAFKFDYLTAGVLRAAYAEVTKGACNNSLLTYYDSLDKKSAWVSLVENAQDKESGLRLVRSIDSYIECNQRLILDGPWSIGLIEMMLDIAAIPLDETLLSVLGHSSALDDKEGLDTYIGLSIKSLTGL